MASDKQRNQFFRVWAHACAEICERYDLCALVKDQEREARHKWVMECTKRTENINAVRPGNEFSRLMLQTAVAAGDYREAAFWERTITKGERTPEDFGRARELIVGSGAIGATLDLAGDYADRAKAAVSALPASDWRAALEDLADFAVSRAA